MPKLLLISVVVAAMAVPMALARTVAPRRGLRATVLATGGIVALWAAYCAYLYPALAGDGR